MKRPIWLIGLVGIFLLGCRMPARKGTAVFDKDNLLAWCIVPFDALERSPEQRARMLQELGIPALAYDYRDAHLPSFPEEIRMLKDHQIELRAVWLWTDPREEDVLGASGRRVFEVLDSTRTRAEIWVGMPENAWAAFA